MRILIAPDKFKCSLTALEAAAAMAEGALRVHPDAETIQFHVAVPTLITPPRTHAFAKTLRGRGREFTGTAVIAIARLDVIRLQAPFGFVVHKLRLMRRAAGGSRFGTILSSRNDSSNLKCAG